MRKVKPILQRRYYLRRTVKLSYGRLALKFHCVRGSQYNTQQYHFTYVKKHCTFWVRGLCLFNRNIGPHIAWGLY